MLILIYAAFGGWSLLSTQTYQTAAAVAEMNQQEKATGSLLTEVGLLSFLKILKLKK